MTTGITADKVINGSFGTIWFNEIELGNVKSFEAKLKAKYEDIDIAGKLGKSRKLVGYEISGTMVLNKVDSTIAKTVSDSFKKGIQPSLKIVGKLADPNSDGDERVSLTGVTLDELTLLKFEQKKTMEEEVPFEAEDYEYIDMI